MLRTAILRISRSKTIETKLYLCTQTTYSRNNMRQKCEGDCGLWVLNEIILKIYAAKLGWKWAGSAVLFSRYLPNGTHDFFQIFRICFFKDFIKNPQTTIALTFLTHIIFGIDGVPSFVLLPWKPPGIPVLVFTSDPLNSQILKGNSQKFGEVFQDIDTLSFTAAVNEKCVYVSGYNITALISNYTHVAPNRIT